MPGNAPNIPLDPSQWETPKSRGIAIIEVCQYETTDDSKTKEGVTFTDFFQLPRPAQTWHVVLKRLDAVYVNKVTGEKTYEVKRYQTLQLERYDATKKVWRPQTAGDNKNNYIIERWLKAGIRLQDPTLAVGMVIEYEVEMTHKFNGNIAKNLLYPLKVLARPGETYDYRGEVEEFEFDPNREDATSLDQAAEEVTSTETSGAKGKAASTKLDKQAVLALIVGMDPEDGDAIGNMVGEHKAELEGPMRTALVSGVFVEEAVEAGDLVVVEGVYALP